MTSVYILNELYEDEKSSSEKRKVNGEDANASSYSTQYLLKIDKCYQWVLLSQVISCLLFFYNITTYLLIVMHRVVNLNKGV